MEGERQGWKQEGKNKNDQVHKNKMMGIERKREQQGLDTCARTQRSSTNVSSDE